MGAASRNGASQEWERVDALFSQALEWPEEEREDRLRVACGGDAALFDTTLELLTADTEAGHFLETPIDLPAEVLADLEVGADPDAGLALETVGPYRLLRIIGRGGMASVWLAERADGAFEREVAVKLLRRGLDTDDILRRFRAERQILADVEHPNIARLLDGGSTPDGRPYLVMEYVRGIPITDYADEHDLPVDARLELFRAVCDAVHHAHLRDVIHRDLKPANILVDRQGHVKLLDFGIARVLGAGGNAARTRTGTRLMTPEYASPEQVWGKDVAAPSDVYQLGMLLYELLSGTRPFHAGGAESGEIERILRRELVAPPSDRAPEELRKRLRGDLDAIALKALRKEPERRYASAEALSRDLERHAARRPVEARSAARAYRLRYRIRQHRVKAMVAAAAVGIAVLAPTIVASLRPAPAPAPLAGAVAVLPFRVSGAEASLGYLREGMVDLMAMRLTGEGGLEAIEPATVLGAWQRAGGSDGRDLAESAALEVARRVGAEQLLLGQVVGTTQSMVVHATLLNVADGSVGARATVRGPADTLPSLVDRLTADLLILEAEEDFRPLGMLASTSLPALRAYLDGRVAVRAARYDEAFDRFNEALELDSTFALAAVRAYQAAWLSPRTGSPQMLEVAWRGRDRLDESDLDIVRAVLGPDYPGPFPQAQRLEARRRLVDRSPEVAELRYAYADRLHHWHAFLGIEDGGQQAAAQFRRALEADSAYAPTYEHLVPLLYSMGEQEAARDLTRTYFRREPNAAVRSFLAWRVAAGDGDPAALATVRAEMAALPPLDLIQIYKVAVQDGIELDDAERAMTVLRRQGLAPSVRRRVLREDFIFRLLRGRPAAAVEVAERLREAQRDDTEFPRLEADNALVLTALYGDGDPAAAATALEALTASTFGSGDAPRPDARLPDLCTVAQWRAWHRERAGVRAAIRHLRSADTHGTLRDTGPLCALLIEAVESTLGNRPDAADRVARLDSALITGPDALFAMVVVPANLASALLNARLGNPERALAAVRRRVYDLDSTNLLLAAALRIEGRLAARLGDRPAAIAAYRHYLALRSDPEATLQPQADSLRAALSELERG